MSDRLIEMSVAAQKASNCNSLSEYYPWYVGVEAPFLPDLRPFYNFPYTFRSSVFDRDLSRIDER